MANKIGVREFYDSKEFLSPTQYNLIKILKNCKNERLWKNSLKTAEKEADH